MATDTEIRCKVINKMVRKNITGAHKVTVDTAKTWVATHDRGRAEELIREMVRDADSPLEAYGGSRDNVRLTSIPDGVAFLKAHDCDVPFGYE
jgi:hypothetical protein